MRLADGRVFTGELPAARHRAIQLGLLHGDGDGLVEIAAGVRTGGRLAIVTRPRPDKPPRADHYLPGGAAGTRDWLDGLLALAERHASRGREVFLAPALRRTPHPAKSAVTHTRVLWVDVDQPDQLHHLWAVLAEKPCHLLIESAGSGGVHAYWKLAHPLPSVQRTDGRVVEAIENAHTRLIHRLGVDATGKPQWTLPRRLHPDPLPDRDHRPPRPLARPHLQPLARTVLPPTRRPLTPPHQPRHDHYHDQPDPATPTGAGHRPRKPPSDPSSDTHPRRPPTRS